MNERVKDEQHLKRIIPAAGPLSESIHVDSLGVRIDPAHPLASELATREVEWQELDHFVPPRPHEAVRHSDPVVIPESTGSMPLNTNFLDTVHQQVQAIKASLDQREKALHLQRSTFEDERKRVASEQTQLDIMRRKVQKEAAEAAERSLALESHVRKFEAERETFLDQRAELERQKKSLRENLLAELSGEKRELEQAKLAFQKDVDHVHVLKEALHTRLEALAADNAQTLKAEREKLWHSLTEEWDQRKLAFQQEQEAWGLTRDLEKSNIERETAMFESAVESANAEFLKARELLAIELAALRDHQATQLEAERREWDLNRSDQETELVARSAALQAETLASREELALEFESLREQHALSLASEREQHSLALVEEREKQVAILVAEREQWEKSRRCEESDLLALRDALELEIDELREKHLNSLSADRADWEKTRDREKAIQEQAKTELAASREALVLELTASREQHGAALRALQRDWEQTRDEENAAVEARQLELLVSCESLEQDMITKRAEHEISLATEREQWEQTRHHELTQLQAQQTELIASCEALKLELISLREQHDAILAVERSEWEQTLESQKTAFAAQQADWVASRDSSLQASRDALEVEFIGLREQHAATLQAERHEWERILGCEQAVLEERQAELIRERTLIENRIRFQQDHLDKSRADLEMAQNEYRRERQVEQQRLEDVGMMMVRRLRQIDLYRSSIDAREKSLDREHEVFSKARKALSSTADLDRLNLQSERHAWDQERQIQQQELLRQQEVLATRAEGLESRRTRLDKLRAELEETHRATLEMRLAVEEAWAQLTHVAGQDDARKRVEQVRQALTGYYQQMLETTAEQRREHLEAQSKFERQRAEFADERQRLTGWLTGRDEELRLGEERLRIAATDAAANHTKWLAARDRWLLEKTEAEQLIRRLLASLGENNREQSSDPEIGLRLEEISVHHEDAFANLDQ